MIKKELRPIYLERQRNLPSSEREKLSKEIADLFFKEFDFAEKKVFHVFLSRVQTNEIETAFVINRLWELQKKVTVPCVNFEKMEIESREFFPSSSVFFNKWQIPEPLQEKEVSSQLIDVVAVPLLCFDRKGYRVGYGKGFYDKFLSRCRKDCLKIGLSYFEDFPKISDINEFDVTLDFCVTPKKVWTF